MTDREPHTSPRRFGSVSIWIAGGSFIGFAVLLSVLSRMLEAGGITREHALAWLASGGLAAGVLYLVGLYRARVRQVQVAPAWIALVAVLARLLVAASPPMLESDYQRYLWDGAVAASGISPYRHAPSDVIARTRQGSDGDRLEDLAREAGPVLTSINHPDLTTIYPPVAQAAFSAAYIILPFSPSGLRILFCLADAATVLLLVRLLRALALPAVQIAWFAWNPLLLREVYSALHMDILLLPLIAAALLAAIRARGGVATAWLVVASAVKVWPIALAPLVLRPLFGQWRRLALTLGACVLLGAALWLPVLLAPHGESSGFLAYGRGWQNNDGFFRAGIWLTERALTAVHIEPWHSHTIMRLTSAALLGGVLLWQLRTRPSDAASLVNRCLFIVGAIFLLSPTQFPWYWLWCLPFLTLRPSLPLLLYTALLPIYYVQDQLVYPLSHWLQHAPVWTLLAIAGARTLLDYRARPAGGLEVSRA
jgi:alpha-1,6-mannosyltransferase